MKFQLIFKLLVFTILGSTIISCDKEFDELGSGVLGNNPNAYTFSKYESEVSAYDIATDAVQSNNLPLNSLGIFNNSVFGATKASYVTQLELPTGNPTFNNPSSIVVDSVYLYVPYFSKLVSTDAALNTSVYTLDSIRGNGRINLKIYENGYFLRNLDATGQLQTTQKYFSNQTSDFDAAIANNGVALGGNNDFGFSNEEIKLTYPKNGDQVVKLKLTPGIFLDLNRDFFKQKIFNAPAGSLTNNTAFKNYFRGLYFKTESIPNNDGRMASLDFASGYIQIIYHQDKLPVPTTGDLRERKEMRLSLAGNSVNLFETATNPVYAAALANANTTAGDSQLYVKGQEGSVAVINLFGSGAANEIQTLKNNGWLINEANLTFYIDKDAMGNTPNPNRLYLYDIKNNRNVVDYFETSSAVNPKFSKFVYGGIIEKETASDENFTKYKVRITSHVNNIINKDSTNVPLGLSVTENIANPTFIVSKNNTNPLLTKVPTSSVINPLGTILHGTNIPSNNINYAKRIKLEIFYTKPD